MIRAILLVCVVLGVVLIGLLFRASSNNTFFSTHYPWLLGVGVALIVGLLALIGYQIFSLWKKLRGRVFGAKLALRLMAVFVLMAVIPGGLVYAISVQFLNRSIDSWFDVPVEKAFEGALNLGKSAIEASLSDVTRKAIAAASSIAESESEITDVLRAQRTKYSFDEISLFGVDGQLIAYAGGKTRLLADKPTRPARGMKHHRQRLGHGGLAGAEAGRIDALRDIGDQTFAERALDMGKRHGAAVKAHVQTLIWQTLKAKPAGGARPAGRYRHQLPGQKPGHVRGCGLDKGRNLMTRIIGSRRRTVPKPPWL